MVTKEALLANLKESMGKEEKGIPLYTMHLANAMFLSGADPKDQKRIQGVLKTLKADSERHKKAYADLIESVKGDSRDVF